MERAAHAVEAVVVEDVAQEAREAFSEAYAGLAAMNAIRILGVDPGVPASVELYMSRVHPDEREKVFSQYQRGLTGDWPAEVEARFVRPNGEVRQARIRTIASR